MPLTHHTAKDYAYPIREIVDIANSISPYVSVPIRWENIGDPVSRGHTMPKWMLDVIRDTLPEATGYCPTRGVEHTREFLAGQHNLESGPSIQAKDILFFNGLGDAIASLMSVLSPEIRMIVPEPGYPSYSTLEALRCDKACISYGLDNAYDWQINLDELEKKLKLHPEIRLLLLLQPSNPLGTLMSFNTMQSLAEIAKKYSLIVISDEIYREHVFEPQEFVSWQAVAGNLPSILLKGISKNLPWPGARCGWMEFLNCQFSEELCELQKVLEKKKMLEVCATTLPQLVIPKLFSDLRLKPWYEESNRFYASRQHQVQIVLQEVLGVQVVKARAAFYTSVLIPSIPACYAEKPPFDSQINTILEKNWINASYDTRFCLWLLVETGICLVPLSSFGGSLQGFRMTVLQRDETKFEKLLLDIQAGLKRILLVS